MNEKLSGYLIVISPYDLSQIMLMFKLQVTNSHSNTSGLSQYFLGWLLMIVKTAAWKLLLFLQQECNTQKKKRNISFGLVETARNLNISHWVNHFFKQRLMAVKTMKKYKNLEAVLLPGEVISAAHKRNLNFQRRSISQRVKHPLISSLAL